MNRPRAAFAALVVLTALTWLTGAAGFRSTPLAGGWSVAPLTDDDAADWSLSAGPGEIAFEPEELTLSRTVTTVGGAATKAWREWSLDPSAGLSGDPDARRRLRVSGTVERVSPPSFVFDRHHRAMFVMIFLREDEPIAYSAVERFSGQYRHRDFVHQVLVPPAADRVRLLWRVRAPGTWQLRDVRVIEVTPSAAYGIAVALLLFAWLALGALVATALVGPLGVRRTVSGALALAAIIVAVSLGQGAVESLFEPVLRAAMALMGGVAPPSAQTLLDGGHALMFALMTAALLAARRALGLRRRAVVAIALTLAFASEALQRHRPGRSAELSDVAIDAGGILFALSLAWLFARALRGRARARSAWRP